MVAKTWESGSVLGGRVTFPPPVYVRYVGQVTSILNLGVFLLISPPPTTNSPLGTGRKARNVASFVGRSP